MKVPHGFCPLSAELEKCNASWVMMKLSSNDAPTHATFDKYQIA